MIPIQQQTRRQSITPLKTLGCILLTKEQELKSYSFREGNDGSSNRMGYQKLSSGKRAGKRAYTNIKYTRENSFIRHLLILCNRIISYNVIIHMYPYTVLRKDNI